MAYSCKEKLHPGEKGGEHMKKDGQDLKKGTLTLKAGLAQMLKGGVIMDVTTPEQAKIAQEAGACAVMALARVPADIRKAGSTAKSVEALAREVINGEWGNGDDRKRRLQAAGYDYTAVQNKVNELLR